MKDPATELNTYFHELSQSGKKIPQRPGKNKPYFRAISASTGIEVKDLLRPPYRQVINLAVQEIGFAPHESTQASRRQELFEKKQVQLSAYLKWLEENGLKLPENPKRNGQVFFAQVEIEVGLSSQSLIIKGLESDRAAKRRFHQMIEDSIPRLGMEVRVLPQSPGHTVEQLTYDRLLKSGLAERAHELTGKPSARQQIYNASWALKKFRESLGLAPTALVGRELVDEFKSAFAKSVSGIRGTQTKRKFKVEMAKWYDFYQKKMKETALPESFHDAVSHLVKKSGLSLRVIATLADICDKRLGKWYRGVATPSRLSIRSVYKLETVFKLPTGALANKVTKYALKKLFFTSSLPDFLRQDPLLAKKVKKHLPDDFCGLVHERQKEIVESIRDEILLSKDPYRLRLAQLSRLHYRLTDWPIQLWKEVTDFVNFKMAERPPIGMKRNGTWRASTKEKCMNDLAFFFGAISLPTDSEDARLRGLGVPYEDLSLALLACPLLVDWYLRFRCEVRNQYTEYAIDLLLWFKSMLRKGTGWLRQNPELATRLRVIRYLTTTEFVSQEFILRAQINWDAICDEAFSSYNHLIKEIQPLIHVSRNPFQPIEGIVTMDNPMKAIEILVGEIRDNLPNEHTQPIRYHAQIRNCALALLVALTGLRRSTVAKLDYTGDEEGHLTFKDGRYELSIPRSFFKNDESAFFVSGDYSITLADAYGSYEVLDEYLNKSRPLLLNQRQSRDEGNPLFVTSKPYGPARLSIISISNAFRAITAKHLAENRWRGTGIRGTKPMCIHSLRHMRATTIVKLTGSFQLAGDSIHISELTARRHYSRFTSKDRNQRVNKILFDVDY
jgi:hypothetical protein